MPKRGIEEELKSLLKLKATQKEKEQLINNGINLKSPTKLTVLAATLYTKAAGGDLSALKEIFARLGESIGDNGGVVIIDDLKS